jgi:hypothetical protein
MGKKKTRKEKGPGKKIKMMLTKIKMFSPHP